MKYIVTIGIILLCTLSINAQTDFRSGFIITNNNDTIHGLIDYKGNKANARKCIFTSDINSKKQVFTPEEIKSYRFTNSKYYISKYVKIENKEKQLFLEYLIKGIVSIYYYRDKHGEHYLAGDESGDIHELKNEKKEIVKNNISYLKPSKKYIGILKYLFNESPSISNRALNTRLNRKSLIKLAHDYHDEVCSDGECLIYEKKLPKFKLSKFKSIFGIVAGVNGMSISQKGQYKKELYFMKGSEFDFKVFPSIGAFCKLNMPSANKRLYFQYEITFSRVNLTTSNSYFDPLYNKTYLNDIDITRNSINNSAFIKYEFPKGKIRPTFQIGGFVNYFFKTDYSRKLEVKHSYGETYYTYQTNCSPFEKYDVGIICGFGLNGIYLSKKEMFCDFRYQRGFGQLQGLNTNVFSIILGMQIGK